MSELKKCAHCGLNGGRIDLLEGKVAKKRVRCEWCGINTAWRESLRDAEEAWNRRAGEEKTYSKLDIETGFRVHTDRVDDLQRTVNDTLTQQSSMLDAIQNLLHRVEALELQTHNTGR